MAKFECRITGYEFDTVMNYFHRQITGGSVSSSYEGGSSYQKGAVRSVVRVYERYTLMGDNRLSMTVMLAGDGQEVVACAITAAGGGGMAKLIGWGENSFLNCFVNAAEQFEGMEILAQE